MAKSPRSRRAKRSSSPSPVERGAKWLMLLLQLPTHPSNARVKTWRRLQQLGAVPLKNSAYVLPDSPEAREDFEWMRTEIIAAKGQASVFATTTADAAEDAQIVEAFRAARQKDFEELRGEIAKMIRKPGRRSLEGNERGRASRAARAFSDRLAKIEAVDFFAAPGGDEARTALAELEQQLAEPRGRLAPKAPDVRLRPEDHRNREWVTRPRPGVDRMASAWLIRHFIDSRARFVFADRPAPSTTKQVPFDMFGAEFSHHSDRCTFEVMADRFGLTMPAIRRIGELVHDLDLKDNRYGAPEAATIRALIEGLRRSFYDDTQLLEQGIVLFEGLYNSIAPAGVRRPRPS